MKSALISLQLLAAFNGATSAYAQDEGRFDAQLFRPLAAPRDLVMVPKSEVIGHLSPVVGVYWDAALNPLALTIGDTGETLDVIGGRLQVTPTLGVGLFDWAELTMAIPFVTWQTSDNLRSIGTEGKIQKAPGIGDVRVSTKVAVPFFNRQDDVRSGFGLALGGDINLPTGNTLAFMSDGGLSGAARVIADYRFNFGLILASNLGVWIRPEHQFAGAKIGDMAQFGLAAEMYIVQRWGLSVIGGVYGYPSLTKFPDDQRQVPAEALLGVRLQTRQGLTLTFGGSFGAACGFGAPALRVWNSITWQPKPSTEQREINRVLEQDNVDPDHDGVIEPADKCPTARGAPEDSGCPATDRDGDTIDDSEDQCPDLVGDRSGSLGCPPARVELDLISTFEPITFGPGSDELSDRARIILESVRRVMADRTDIREVVIEGHADMRESGEYRGYVLSKNRAANVGAWLADAGILEERILVSAFGHSQPAFDDTDCGVPDESLPPSCERALELNRRVVVRIKRWGARPTREILGPELSSVLETRRELEAGRPALFPGCRPWTKGDEAPTPCVLPMKPAVLSGGHVLENAKDAEGRLPKSSTQSLPTGGVLPNEDGALPELPR